MIKIGCEKIQPMLAAQDGLVRERRSVPMKEQIISNEMQIKMQT